MGPIARAGRMRELPALRRVRHDSPSPRSGTGPKGRPLLRTPVPKGLRRRTPNRARIALQLTSFSYGSGETIRPMEVEVRKPGITPCSKISWMRTVRL